MSIGIFTGTIKSIERRDTDEEDFLCTVWLTVADLGEQCLRATARNEVAHQMDQVNQGDLITVSGVVDLDLINQPRTKKKAIAIPKVLQVHQMNQLTLVGYAGSDPTVKRVQNKETGDPGIVAKFNLAVNPPRQSEEPNWFALEFWSRNAEVVEEFVKKGSLIEVTGSVRMEFWQDRQTGDDRARPVVRVDRLQLLGGKRPETEQQDTKTASPSGETTTTYSQPQASSSPSEAAVQNAVEKPKVKREKSTTRKAKKAEPPTTESTELMQQAH